MNQKIYLGGAKLAKGGFSKVSDTQSLPTDSFVGVKIVGRGASGVRSLESNLSFIENLTHLGVPNITPVHRFKVYTKTKQGEPKIVALVSKLDGDGTTLVNLKVNPIHICIALIDVSDALAMMHKNQYVHGDVKPANLLVRGNTGIEPGINSQGQLEAIGCLLHDFGGSGKTGETLKTPTPAYAAPEVLADFGTNMAPEQDAFSFGALIFEMASASRDFRPKGWAAQDPQMGFKVDVMKRALDIAERLLTERPQNRMTVKEASAMLRRTLDRHLKDKAEGIIDQKLENIKTKMTVRRGKTFMNS